MEKVHQQSLKYCYLTRDLVPYINLIEVHNTDTIDFISVPLNLQRIRLLLNTKWRNAILETFNPYLISQ